MLFLKEIWESELQDSWAVYVTNAECIGPDWEM